MDKEIWLRIGNNDQEAYSVAFEHYYRNFYNYGKKFTDDTPLIEDAIQETLLDLWDKRSRLASLNFENAYFYSTFRFILFRRLKQQRQFTENNDAGNDPEFSVDNVIIKAEADAELQMNLQTAIKALTPRQREAIFLRFYEGFSYDQVATVMNITPKATYKIMARAIDQLKGHMAIHSGLATLLLLGFK